MRRSRAGHLQMSDFRLCPDFNRNASRDPRRHVENDTRKMAIMLAERGLVFWHDYGGRGSFRGLTEYLEELSRRISLYHVINTTLAWAPASELRKIV